MYVYMYVYIRCVTCGRWSSYPRRSRHSGELPDAAREGGRQDSQVPSQIDPKQAQVASSRCDSVAVGNSVTLNRY